MKLQILFAMMLLTVVAFAQDVDSINVAVDSSVTGDETNSVSDDTVTNVIDENGVNQEDFEDAENPTGIDLDLDQIGSTDDLVPTSVTGIANAVTISTTGVTDELEPTLNVEPVLYEDGSDESITSLGFCEFDQKSEEGETKVVVECALSLPNPCHTVEYGWIPGAQDNVYTFLVHIRDRPGVMCAQVIYETEVRTEQIFLTEDLNFDYKINYVPAKELRLAPLPTDIIQEPTVDFECDNMVRDIKRNIERLEQQLERAKSAGLDSEYVRVKNIIRQELYSLETFSCVRDVITKELPTASLCTKQRIDAEMRLKDLHLTLSEAEISGDVEAINKLELKIRDVKAELISLPTVDRCATTMHFEIQPTVELIEDKLGQFYERLRDFNIIMRVANPCDKVTFIDEKITELESTLSDISDDEVTVRKNKIGVLVDTKSNMERACTAIKENTNCGEAVQMRNNFNNFIEKVQSGNIDGVRLDNNAKDLITKFTRLQSACLDDVKQMFDNHPCMGAQVLEIEVERMSSLGESPEILPDIYNKMTEFREACFKGEVLSRTKEQVRNTFQDAREAKFKANDIAQIVGELELRKHIILADDELSSAEKSRIVREIEAEKTALIKDVVTQFKRAKITSAMKVKLSKDAFEVEDESFDAKEVTLELTTSDGSLEVTAIEDRIELRSKNARITARIELEFENGRLMIRGKALRMPDEVLSDVGALQGDLELNDDGTTATYEGIVKKQFRLFAIIPLHADVFVKTDAEAGDILEMRRPWWAVFAVE
ncbi:MAG: hypothetical protein GOU98_02695 [Candidatus Altiarchaeota archaeon]|nr:hypothetical protein [Candidatus Altiarchaeota archaeon]